MVATEEALLRASRRAVAGWEHMHGSFGNPNRWDVAMQDLMGLVDECNDRDLSSCNARLLDVARNAVDSWVGRKKHRKNNQHYADEAMENLQKLVTSVDRPSGRRWLRVFLPVVTFLAGMITGAIVYWILTV